MTESEYENGDVVWDRDDPNPNEAIVINTPPAVASEWLIKPRECTLADDNPEYPADDPVVCVIYDKDMQRSRPFYTGYKPIKLNELGEFTGKMYSFPESRLEKVGERGPIHINLDAIRDSPYHTRNFDPSEYGELVARAEREGTTFGYPLVRRVTDGFELVNGHKRIWAAREAGLLTHECNVVYLSEREATEWFLNAHLTDGEHQEAYRGEELHECVERLEERWGDIAEVFDPYRQVKLSCIAERLGNGEPARIDGDHVVFEKLGETYRINAEGEVVSGGSLSERVSGAAKAAVEGVEVA